MTQQCDRCGGWFGLAWTCSACLQLARYLTSHGKGTR